MSIFSKMKLRICLVLLIVFLLSNNVKAKFTISSPVLTNTGALSQFQSCVDGSFITGLDVAHFHYKSDVFDDDLGLLNIIFQCSPTTTPTYISTIVNGVTYEITTAISNEFSNSKFGPDIITYNFTNYREEGIIDPPIHIVYTLPLRTLCSGNGLAVGFQFNSQADEGSRDKSGGNNIRLLCSSNLEMPLEAYGSYQGTWTDIRQCGPRHALCGIQTQADDLTQPSGDHVAIENIRMQCCPVQNPASICTPTTEWMPIERCQYRPNTSTKIRPCNFTRTIGIGLLASQTDEDFEDYILNESIGYTATDGSDIYWLTSALSKNCKNLPIDPDSRFDWANAPERTWTPEISTYWYYEALEREVLTVSQLVAKCSYFSVKTGMFKMEIENGDVTYVGL